MPANKRKSLPFSPLSFAQSIDLLQKNGVGFCNTVFVENYNGQGVLAAAQKVGFPVILKVVSAPSGPNAIHKARESLVAKAENAYSFAAAYNRLAASHARLAKRKVIESRLIVAVQEEITGSEFFVGAKRDSLFGSVILFGTGGVLAEEIDDVALGVLAARSASVFYF